MIGGAAFTGGALFSSRESQPFLAGNCARFGAVDAHRRSHFDVAQNTNVTQFTL